MKKTIVLIIVMLTVTNALTQLRISSYNINSEFIPDENKISINANLKFQKDIQLDTLLLLFNSNCRILNINSPLNETMFDLKYFKGGRDTLFVLLNENLKSSTAFAVNFSYEYPLEKDTAVLLDRGHRWYPMVAENIFVFTMTVQIPQNYITVSAGDIINERIGKGFKQISFESSQPVFKIPLIIAPENYYTVKEKGCGKIKSFFYEINNGASDKFDSVNTDVCNLIDYFSELVGEYPHKRFTLVETFAFPGSNLGSSIVTSGKDNFESYLLGNKDWLSMAVASQWIGTSVFPRLFSKGFWFLSISFPHYLRLMYERHTKGQEFFDMELNKLGETYKKIAGTENEVSILEVDYPNTREKGILLYAKGVIVLDKLAKQLGEGNWINLLKYFYAQYNGNVIILDDFVSIINKFDPSGTSANSLLDMLSAKGYPE